MESLSYTNKGRWIQNEKHKEFLHALEKRDV